MTLAPAAGGTERTTTVVIGSGLSGLAVASELSRQGVDSIVVDSLELFGAAPTARASRLTEPGTLIERSEILRVLRHYASNHSLDIRASSKATGLRITAGAASAGDPQPQQWLVNTSDGVLLADNIVLTRCAQGQLRRFFASLGIAIGHDLTSAMRALGIYLVGIGDAVAPSTREILRQAKTVSEAICVSRQPRSAGLAAIG